MDPTVFVEDRGASTPHTIDRDVVVLDVGEDATIATIYLSRPDGLAAEGEAAWIAAQLNHILDPDVMDAMVAKGLIAFEIETPMAPPQQHIFYKPHDLAFAIMRATSSRGCISLIGRSAWKESQLL